MRVLVCGSRHFNDYSKLKEILDGYKINTIIHGAAHGADTLAGIYGARQGMDVLSFKALWDIHGRAAGPIRNAEMLTSGRPDLVIAFRGPNSRGTQDMINKSRKAGVPVCIVDIQ